MYFVASGKKLTIASKRPANMAITKSQTLPRSMGSRTTPVQPVRPFNKISSTPPAVKKQLSVPGNTGSPARKLNANNTGRSCKFLFKFRLHCYFLLLSSC